VALSDEPRGRPIPNEPPEPTPLRRQKPLYAGNLEAERALLGAMLLTVEAVEAGLSVCTSSDFVLPEHGHAFTAMAEIFRRGDPVDLVTVSDQLAREGLLEQVGGNAALLEWHASVVSTSNAAKYARIVHDLALMRRARMELDEIRNVNDLPSVGAILAKVDAFLTEEQAHVIEFEDVAAVLKGEVDEVAPTMLRRDDGQALIYPGLTHWLMGEPGKGKTWVALYAAAEVLADGGAVMYLDWEGSRRIVGARLKALGCDVTQVDERFLYHRPQRITASSAAFLAGTVANRGVSLVVCDGVAKALARQGLNEDKAPEVLQWLELVVNPIADAGAAVLMLDHVVKEKEGRGLWARGSGAKLGEVTGAAWMVAAKGTFSRTKKGSFSLVQAKDREGFVAADGETVAVIHAEPSGGNLTLRVHAPEPKTDEVFRPTVFMERISRELQKANAAGLTLSKRAVRATVKGSNDTKDLALETLVAEGYVAQTKDGYRHVRPFYNGEEEG
jgi:hypothetical protein